MRNGTIWFLSIAFIACRKEPVLEIHPLKSNVGVERLEIEKLGFTVTTLDHGYCIYEKQFDSLRMYFMFDDAIDECTKSTLQGVEFPFGEFSIKTAQDSIDLRHVEFPMDIAKDSIEISRIIENLGGRIVSPRQGWGPFRANYEVISRKTKLLFTASIDYHIDSLKYLIIETSEGPH